MTFFKSFFAIIICFVFFQTQLTGQFVYGDKSDEEEKISFIDPPIPKLQPEFSTFRISAEKEHEFYADKSTTIITIPKNAFVDREGNVVKGKVDVKYRKLNNPLDIFLSGIPMTIEENGVKEVLQSAGMLEFRVSQDGQPVFPNLEGEPITFEFTSNQNEDGYHQYSFNEKTGEWVETGLSVAGESSKNLKGYFNHVNIQACGEPFLDTIPVSIRVLNDNTANPNYIDYKSDEMQFTIEAHKDSRDNSFNPINKCLYPKYYSEFDKKEIITWLVDETTDQKIAQEFYRHLWLARFDRHLKQGVDPYVIEDIKIIPNPNEDNYLITFECKYNSTLTIKAYPYLLFKSTSLKRQNSEFYSEYKKAYDKRCNDWVHVEKAYQRAKEKYEQKKRDGELVDAVQRKIGIRSFGILNIDKIYKKLNEERPCVFYLNKEKCTKIKNFYVLDKTNNAMLSYEGGQDLQFDNAAKNSLIVELEDNAFATISKYQFQDAYKESNGDEMVFSLQNLQLSTLTREILENALNAK